MSTDPQTPPPGPTAEQPLDDQHLVLLRRIEHHLGRIADVLEALSPTPTQIVKDLGPVRDVPKPGPADPIYRALTRATQTIAREGRRSD